MAMVLACADHNRIVIKCDGREVSEHGAVLSEEHTWFTKLTPQCIVGYIGDSMVCEMLMVALKQGISSDTDLTTQKIAEQLQGILGNTTDTTEGCSFIVAGIDQAGTHLYGCSYQDGFKELMDKTPSDPNVICENLSIGPAALSSASTFSQMFDQKKSIESNMNGYIRYISSLDVSVNDRIQTEKIRKK